MIQLYPHQEKFVSDIREAFRNNKSVLAQAPCGFGKTVIASYMAHRVSAKGKRIYFLCHRRELLRQTANTFNKEGIKYGVIAPGYFETKHSVQIATMQTILRRLGRHTADLIFIDEAHMSRAKGWSTIINHFKSRGAWICGLSASPIRLDGQGLGEHFQKMVLGPSTRWMIEHGFLSDYRYFAPTAPNLSNVHLRMGDYVSSELSSKMDKPSITGDAILHWKKHADGLRTLVYCVGINHSQRTAAAFTAAGIPAVHVDGETLDFERMNSIRRFADGSIKVITNCALWTEGLDISSFIGREVPIECVVLLRPTRSVALTVQMHGRGLRRKAQPAIFLDHANIVQTHGLPDEERQWTLDGQMARKKEMGTVSHVRICPKCFAAQISGAPSCRFCGFVFEVTPRRIDEKEGELSEVDVLALRRERAREQAGAESLEELTQIGIQRKYRFPRRWAHFVFQARQAKRLGNLRERS